MFNSTKEKQLLGKLCRAVEETGGIQYTEHSTSYIIASPGWTDLAYLYVEAARALGITIRGCWGKVQHYWLPDGTLLKPELLNGVRRKLIEEKPLTENAEEYLKHVLTMFHCTVNDFELKLIMAWCKEAGPPGMFLPAQSSTLEWAPPDLVDLNTIAYDLVPGEINNLLRIPWYIPSDLPLILVSSNEAGACLYVTDHDTLVLYAPRGGDIDSVTVVKYDCKMYADEKFFVT